MEPSWDSPELTVASDNERNVGHRSLQSWYREHVLGDCFFDESAD